MNDNFEFIQSGPTGGDCTAPYNIRLKKKYTVSDFIAEVLKEHKGDWGVIRVFTKGCEYPWDHPGFGYRYGEIKGDSRFSENILDKEISYVTAAGGWTAMDYMIHLKEDN